MLKVIEPLLSSGFQDSWKGRVILVEKRFNDCVYTRVQILNFNPCTQSDKYAILGKCIMNIDMGGLKSIADSRRPH